MEDVMIRELFTRQSENLLRMNLSFLAIKQCLMDKGLITEQDFQNAVQKVHRESKQTLQGMKDQSNPEKQN